MINGEFAKYRIEDRVRDGNAERATRRLAARRASERRARVGRMAAVTAALLPLPIKH